MSASPTLSKKAYNHLYDRAEQGDHLACQLLYHGLEIDGLAQRFVHLLTDTALRLTTLCLDDLVLREALDRKALQLAQSLGVDTASPLETLLIERIVVCWLRVHLLETEEDRCFQPGRYLRLAEFQRRSLNSALKRYLDAIKALERLRKIKPIPTCPLAEDEAPTQNLVLSLPAEQDADENNIEEENTSNQENPTQFTQKERRPISLQSILSINTANRVRPNNSNTRLPSRKTRQTPPTQSLCAPSRCLCTHCLLHAPLF